MTRKIFIIYLTIFILSISTLFIQSCRDIFYPDGQIKNVCFTGLNVSLDNSPDKFTDQVGFIVKGFEENRVCDIPLRINFFSSCYALTKCRTWQNSFNTTSFQIKLDKKVIIAGDTINSNYDLFQNSLFRNNTTITKEEDDCKFIEMRIILLPNLISQMTFEHGTYNVTFNCETSDNETFMNERKVIFKN